MTMRDQILAAVKTVLAPGGSRKVRVTFKREETFAPTYLQAMAMQGVIKLENGYADLALIVAIRQSENWERDENRIFTVTLTDKYDENFFVGRMQRPLENIEAVA